MTPPASADNADQVDIISAAISYIEAGWAPIPIPPGVKAPALKDWQHLRLREDDVPKYFRPGMNIGVLLGGPSGSLVDVDLDSADALFLAPCFLPFTGAVFGMPGKPESHWLYVVNDSLETLRLKDVDGSVIVELRGKGCQTVFPPSVHSGERVAWTRKEQPTVIDVAVLLKSVRLLASACLLVPYWPKEGSRHDTALALAGALLAAGLEEDSVKSLLKGVCVATGDDETKDRLETVSSTALRINRNLPATGWQTLRKMLGAAPVDRLQNFISVFNSGAHASNSKAPTTSAEKNTGSNDKATIAERLLELSKDIELFHTPEKDGFASILVESHQENWPIQSREFKRWLARCYYKSYGKPPGRDALNDVIGILEAGALFDGPKFKVFTRFGWDNDCVYLDLCDPDWQVVRVSADGFELLHSSPVRFRRATGMLVQ